MQLQLDRFCDCADISCTVQSFAILKYLVRKYKLADHWYPADIRSQAKVDEYFGWHGTNLRRGAAWLIGTKVLP